MASEQIKSYLNKRYERYLDYASYHCKLAGIADEARDVLGEVLLSLLQKNDARLDAMYGKKKNGYTELDFFVLRMIKLNATSMTSPYRSKYKPLPTDSNVDYRRLDIEDMPEPETDAPADLLDRFSRVREAFEGLHLSPFARRVFHFRFFEDRPFAEWEGKEEMKVLYDTYNGVVELIKSKLNGNYLF